MAYSHREYLFLYTVEKSRAVSAEALNLIAETEMLQRVGHKLNARDTLKFGKCVQTFFTCISLLQTFGYINILGYNGSIISSRKRLIASKRQTKNIDFKPLIQCCNNIQKHIVTVLCHGVDNFHPDTKILDETILLEEFVTFHALVDLLEDDGLDVNQLYAGTTTDEDRIRDDIRIASIKGIIEQPS